MRRKLIVGNWKMNGSLVFNSALLAGLKADVAQCNGDIAVCVPAPYLYQCCEQLSGTGIAWGAQDVSAYDSGAFTGEVSASMLTDFSCKYVIIGHSERRAQHGESDELVASKVVRALASGLTPIVCVGETFTEYDAGRTKIAVGGQIDSVLAAIGDADVGKIVVAYEPVWAVGTGRNATPEIAQEVHFSLRSRLSAKNSIAAMNTRILYGGSMKPENAKKLLSMPDVDGGLIGGAALKAADFLAIAQAAD